MTILDTLFTDAEITLSNGDLTATHSTSTIWHRSSSDDSHTTGKWAFEFTANTAGSGGGSGVQISVGIISDANRLASGYLGQFGLVEAGIFWDGQGITNNSFVSNIATAEFGSIGDVVMVLVDLDAGIVETYVDKHGVRNLSIPTFSPSGDMWAAVGLDGNAASSDVNFGATAFVNPLPAGYLSWDESQVGGLPVAKTFAFDWDVSDSVGVVSKPFAFDWDVAGEPVAVNVPFEFQWDVDSAEYAVNKKFEFSWSISVPVEVCRAFRAIRDEESVWRGFSDRSTVMTRGPLINDAYDRYYITQDNQPVRYTTFDVLSAEARGDIRNLNVDNYLRLGVPQPQLQPFVETSGGTEDLIVDRGYVYTWMSVYGEEGPPSEAIVASGADDGLWVISGFDTAVPYAEDRRITGLRLYRTVTSTFGTAQFHFVADLPLNTAEYIDNQKTEVIGLNFTLESTSWYPPPEDLRGLVAHPNGFFVAYNGRDIYFSEPYRPHAWPPEYVLSTLGDIVGFGIFGTTVVVCTESFPHNVTGINPAGMVLTKHDTAEPCLSRYGITSMPYGVLYPGPNGLMLANESGFVTITDNLITKEEWQTKYNPRGIDSARWQNSYVGFYSGEKGFLLSPNDPLYTFIELNEYWDNCGIQTDEYSGKVILCTGTKIYEWNPPSGANVSYVWESKEFDIPDPKNFGAFRIIYYGDPIPSDAQIEVWREYNTERIQQFLDPLDYNALATVRKVVPDNINPTPENRTPLGGPVLYPIPAVGDPWPNADTLTAEFIANDAVVSTQVINTTDMLRLPAGFKATRWKIRLSGEVKVKSVKMAETGKELATV